MTSTQQPTSPPAGSGGEDAWVASGHLMSGIGVWGGIGALVDWWLGIPKHFGLLVGMLVGAAAAIYLIVKRLGSS
jgi:ATP synthase protein I